MLSLILVPALYPVLIGILGAITVMIVMARIGIRKFMGYPAILDVLVTVLLALLFHGTYAGMMAAVIGGLFFSLCITLIRRLYGYERYTLKGWKVYDAKTVQLIKRYWR